MLTADAEGRITLPVRGGVEKSEDDWGLKLTAVSAPAVKGTPAPPGGSG